LSFAVDLPGQTDSTEKETPLSTEQLQAALAASEERAVRAEQGLDRERDRLDSFLTTPPTTPQTTERIEPPPPMPDIVEQPDAYRAWHLDKDRRAQLELDARLNRESEERRTDIAAAESRGNLWNTFQTQYPEHAALSDLARPAYQNILQRRNPPNDVNGLAKAISEEMNSMVGTDIKKIAKTVDRSSDTSAGENLPTPKPKAKTDEDDGENVTMHSAISAFKIKYGLI